jgi:hypothetical protein
VIAEGPSRIGSWCLGAFFVVAGSSGEGLLTERITVAQPWRRELIFMPHSGASPPPTQAQQRRVPYRQEAGTYHFGASRPEALSPRRETSKLVEPDHRPRRAHTSLRDLGLLRGGTQRLTAYWYSAPHHTDDDGERPRPIGQAGQIPAADVPLDLGAQLRRQCRYTLANLTNGHRKTGPVVLERRVIETDHDRRLDYIHETALAPDCCLSVCPHDWSRLSLVSHRAHSFVEDGCRVAHQVGGGKAAPEIKDAGSNGPAAAGHPPHLADDLIDFRYDIDSKGRDARIEGGVRIWHTTRVA